MRWWLNTDHKRFSVDNAVVSGLDFSALDPDIWMVQWIDGKGEIERQNIVTDENLNGLREPFIDITPYAPIFQQFLALCPLLTLPQAKKVQIDLIIEIYNSKRQAPYHYPVAAGDYWWDASDAAGAVNPTAAIQSIIATLNSLIGKVNTLAHEINSIVVGQVNSVVVGGVNGNVVGGVNAAVVGPGNNLVADYNAYVIGVLNNSLIPYINDTVLGTNAQTVGAVSVNRGLFAPAGQSVTPSGIPSDIPRVPFGFSASGVGFGNISGVAGIAGVNWSDQSTVPGQAGSTFVPIGGTVPVPVTAAEIAAIQSGIAARAQDLNVKKNVKIGEVNALTTVPAVIAYDVTTGW